MPKKKKFDVSFIRVHEWYCVIEVEAESAEKAREVVENGVFSDFEKKLRVHGDWEKISQVVGVKEVGRDT